MFSSSTSSGIRGTSGASNGVCSVGTAFGPERWPVLSGSGPMLVGLKGVTYEVGKLLRRGLLREIRFDSSLDKISSSGASCVAIPPALGPGRGDTPSPSAAPSVAGCAAA